MLTIPASMEEAARIDGCNSLSILYRILLPLLKPPLTAVVIFQFTETWNDFIQPLIYITRDEMKPLALGLESFQAQFSEEWSMLMAAAAMMVIPVVLVFFACQKYFIRGVVMSGLKQ